jgi:hypothetical protein
VEWLRPNRRRSALFGLLRSIAPGHYRFAPAGAADPSALARLLEEHLEHTSPPEARTDLASLLAKLRAQ